jgi:O-antigen/teichoic acid export membrane protein
MAFSVVSRVAGLGALTAAGQLLIIGSLPAYSKIFDPGMYGEYVIFVGAYTVISVLAGVRYDSAIVLPRSDALAATLSALVMLIAIAVSALIAAAVLLAWTFDWAPDRWLRIERDFGYGLAAATAIGALQRCLIGWCVRSSRFLLMGFGQFLFCLVTVIAQLSFARLMGQLPALIWGFVCALGFQTACLATLTLHLKRPVAGIRISLRAMGVVARKYRRFPTYMVGYALASSMRDRLVQVVLGIGAGAAVVGRFGLAYRVVFAPNSLVYSAVSPVFFRIASRGTRQAVGRFAAGLVEATFVVLVVPYVAFAIEAPALTEAVLSEKWRGTGPYLQALSGAALLLSATCWLDRAFDSFRRQNVAFLLEASFTLISISLIACLSRFVNAVAVVWAFGGLAILYYWVYFLVTFVACGFPLADFRRVCLTGLVAIAGALIFGASIHQLPVLELRLPAYALLMVIVILSWIRFGGGTDIIKLLMQSRVRDGADG